MAREFMKNCHKLGIKVHGTFIIGLPVETPETVRETIEFAKELDPHTIQVSIASPYPGTVLYDQALANGWFARQDLVSGSNGIQTSTLRYDTLSTAEIEDSVERMYREFYFRPKKIAKIVGEMVTSRQMMVRRLREGGEFFGYLRAAAHLGRQAPERGRDGLSNLRIGSPEHRDLFCRTFIETHLPFEPEDLPWPRLEARLRRAVARVSVLELRAQHGARGGPHDRDVRENGDRSGDSRSGRVAGIRGRRATGGCSTTCSNGMRSTYPRCRFRTCR